MINLTNIKKVIDFLFQIDHLENTNERLEQQIKVLKAQLDQCHCEPLTPDTANSVTSPLSQDTL